MANHTAAQNECAVLLHGLARSNNAMEKLANALGKSDYQVVNVDYDSTKHPVEILAMQAIPGQRSSGYV